MKNLFKNCLTVIDTEHGYFPCRFTDKQLEVYLRNGPACATRSRCAASVCMSFYTAKDEIGFSYNIASFARKNVAFDVYENDYMVTTIPQPDQSESGRITYRKRNHGSTKITIYLPPCAEVMISDLDIGEYTVVPDRKKKLLLFGDSITQGMTSMEPSLTFATLLSNYLDCTVLNQSVGGYTFREESLDQDLPFFPDAIYVAYGTNDYTVSLTAGIEPFKQRCEAYIQKLCAIYPEIPIYIQTPTPRFDLASEDRIQLFAAVGEFIKDTALAFKITAIDGYSLIPEHQSFFTDRIHPNDLGFLVYAKNLEKQIVFKD